MPKVYACTNKINHTPKNQNHTLTLGNTLENKYFADNISVINLALWISLRLELLTFLSIFLMIKNK